MFVIIGNNGKIGGGKDFCNLDFNLFEKRKFQRNIVYLLSYFLFVLQLLNEVLPVFFCQYS